MGRTTIEWVDYTFNPWEGCTIEGRRKIRLPELDGRQWAEQPLD